MRKSSPTIRKVLENTEFSGLIEKFNSLGIEYIFDLIPTYNSGQLLNYIKNFENDNEKALKLESILRQQLVKNSNPAFQGLFWFIAIFCVLMFILLMIGLSKK